MRLQVGGEMRLARSIEQINTEFFEALDKVQTTKPSTLNPNSEPYALNPQPSSQTLDPKLSTLNPQPEL